MTIRSTTEVDAEVSPALVSRTWRRETSALEASGFDLTESQYRCGSAERTVTLAKLPLYSPSEMLHGQHDCDDPGPFWRRKQRTLKMKDSVNSS